MMEMFIKRSFDQRAVLRYPWLNSAILVIIFVIYSTYILLQSYFHQDGFVSSDSAHYLQMAENLMMGKGMETTSLVNGISTYFAVWPAGYPLLIAGVSILTGLSVFWASKLVNIIMLALSLWLIKRLFKRDAFLFAMIFFVSTFTEVMVYTWSEVPFFFGLIWLAFSVIRYIETDRIHFAGQMMASSMFLFLMRYIGLFAAGFVGLVGFYFLWKRKWKAMWTCWIAGVIPIVAAVLYLFRNYQETGFWTGMPRVERVESIPEFFMMLKNGLIAEFNLFSVSSEIYLKLTIMVLILSVLVFLRPKHLLGLFRSGSGDHLAAQIFSMIGGLYLIMLALMRFQSHFDPFNFRLLGPATLMFWLGIFAYIRTKEVWPRFRMMFLAVFLVCFYMNIGYQTYLAAVSPSNSYPETREEVLKLYEEIPAESIVVFENIHARYLRPDLQYIKPYFTPYFPEKESAEEFLRRIDENHARGVYVHVRPLREDRYHKSFIDLMKDHQGETFVQIR